MPWWSHFRGALQWLQQADAAFDLYFDGEAVPVPVTFAHREGRACSLTRELAAWLLEQDLAADPAVRPDDAQPAGLPAMRPARPTTHAAGGTPAPAARGQRRRGSDPVPRAVVLQDLPGLFFSLWTSNWNWARKAIAPPC